MTSRSWIRQPLARLNSSLPRRLAARRGLRSKAWPASARGSRVDFAQPVTVLTEDGLRFTLLGRDLSATGIRLLGTRRLLGQRVRVLISLPAGAGPGQTQAVWSFQVRILWTCAVGDDLFENGGTFIVVNPQAERSER